MNWQLQDSSSHHPPPEARHSAWRDPSGSHEAGMASNTAVHVRAPVMDTVPVVHPVPCQPTNWNPSAGSAVNWTLAPDENDAVHDAPHEMPLGLLVTRLSSLPSPVFWMVSV